MDGKTVLDLPAPAGAVCGLGVDLAGFLADAEPAVLAYLGPAHEPPTVTVADVQGADESGVGYVTFGLWGWSAGVDG